MKVFVTTGTTEFEQLIESVMDLTGRHEIIVQTPKNHEPTVNCQFIDFVENIYDYYQWADVIVTHAGAGSVYKLLELRRQVLVVPNLSRKDKHQSQIADYVRENNYGAVCYDFSKLSEAIQECYESQYAPYEVNKFDDVDRILKLFELEHD
ncbi:glycosyltransferase domain-containing protein [Catenovulum agarivorans DS-2]|uniref:Glycosyltransferase domain-containing protein n=1 Tax=Catenovulum agarivorans DS-2 TaxID=1328313 RepID=W7QHU0_9ALTE|nr:PssE/Cps14G family polysaccharide biosynthesis glycosyltransferase [Catenovulum agarivorans]EWH08492.1 glycosyltransferase domain-containing protein [Catenovulum agarivorans DS-2]